MIRDTINEAQFRQLMDGQRLILEMLREMSELLLMLTADVESEVKVEAEQ